VGILQMDVHAAEEMHKLSTRTQFNQLLLRAPHVHSGYLDAQRTLCAVASFASLRCLQVWQN